MAPRQHGNLALEGFGEQRVVERREEDQQGAAPQVQLQTAEDIAKIGTDALRFQIVNSLAAEAEVVHAVAGAQKAGRTVAESRQPEAVAGAFRHQRQME